jgi:hypothetical protein
MPLAIRSSSGRDIPASERRKQSTSTITAMILKGEGGEIKQVEMHLHATVAIPPYVVARRYEKGRVKG